MASLTGQGAVKPASSGSGTRKAVNFVGDLESTTRMIGTKLREVKPITIKDVG